MPSQQNPDFGQHGAITRKLFYPATRRRAFLLLLLGAVTISCNDSGFSGASRHLTGQSLSPVPGPKLESLRDFEAKLTIRVGVQKTVSEVISYKPRQIVQLWSNGPDTAQVNSEEASILGVSPGKTIVDVAFSDGLKGKIRVRVVTDDDEFDMGDANIDADEHDADSDNKLHGYVSENDLGDGPILKFDDSFSGTFLTKPLDVDMDHSLWGVTRDGTATWLKLEGDQVVATKRWHGLAPGSSGSRTYVSEFGVLIARTGGYLYWIDPQQTPEGNIPQVAPNFYHLREAGGSRICAVAYRKDKKRYVGVGWGNGNFIEFPTEDQPPYAPLWNSPTGRAQVAGVKWGYSCYIDQERLIYYSQWSHGSDGVGAVDLKAMRSIAASIAPNAGFVSNKLRSATVGSSGGGSYAMGGDLKGNVYNGRGFYTMTHDRGSKTVWGSAGGVLHIYPDKCLTRTPDCTGHASFAMAKLNISVGPISALSDGRVVGMSRSDRGRVYLLKLRDKSDLSQGIDAKVIAELNGDPYMYNDFTGATLFMTSSLTKFDLNEGKGFDRSKAIRAIGLTWQVRNNRDPIWKDIQLEIRCYASDGSQDGDFEPVETIEPAGKQSIVRTAGCANQSYDQVELRLSQLEDNDTLMGVDRIQLTAYQ